MSIKYLGDYIPAAHGRAANESFWSSDVVQDGIKRQVVDAAGFDEEGNDVVRLIPYGINSQAIANEMVEDGDLLAYIRDRNVIQVSKDQSVLLSILKGRASHAELAYCDDRNGATHISLWDAMNPVKPTDCSAFHEHADKAALGVYRISLKNYGVDIARERLLKAGVRKWKEIIRPVNFPNGVLLNYDPVDFSDLDSLGKLAQAFINHSPEDRTPPVDCKFNCVQWSTLVFSLAICYPLTEVVLDKLGVKDAFDRLWKDRVGGYSAKEAIALDVLPIPFYTPLEVAENALDMYFPEAKALLLPIAKQLPVDVLLNRIGLNSDSRVIMPSAFIIEQRLRALGIPRKTETIFEYVATALPESEVIKRQ